MSNFKFFLYFFPCNSSLFLLSFYICPAYPLIWWTFVVWRIIKDHRMSRKDVG